MRVTYVWRDGDRVRLLATQFPGDATDPGLIKKFVASGTRIDLVYVDGYRALWLEGGPHAVLFVAPDGGVRDDLGWLAGNTLLVAANGSTLRIEAQIDRKEAISWPETSSNDRETLERGMIPRSRGYLERVSRIPGTRDGHPSGGEYNATGGGKPCRARPARRAGAPATPDTNGGAPAFADTARPFTNFQVARETREVRVLVVDDEPAVRAAVARAHARRVRGGCGRGRSPRSARSSASGRSSSSSTSSCRSSTASPCAAGSAATAIGRRS